MSDDRPGSSSSGAAGDEGAGSAGALDPESCYKAPAETTIDEIVSKDADDLDLVKYKETLLGSAVAGTGSVVVEPDDSRNVIVKRLTLITEGRDDRHIDLTGDLKEIKKTVILGSWYNSIAAIDSCVYG